MLIGVLAKYLDSVVQMNRLHDEQFQRPIACSCYHAETIIYMQSLLGLLIVSTGSACIVQGDGGVGGGCHACHVKGLQILTPCTFSRLKNRTNFKLHTSYILVYFLYRKWIFYVKAQLRVQ